MRPSDQVAPTEREKEMAAKEKAPRDFDNIDWAGRFEDKDPTDLHVTFAKLIEQRSGVEITAKQVQAVLSMHPYFQRSKHNKSRPGYVGLDEEIVHQRSVHMVAAHQDAAFAIAEREAQKAKKPARKTAAKKAAPPEKKPVTRRRTAKKTAEVKSA